MACGFIDSDLGQLAGQPGDKRLMSADDDDDDWEDNGPVSASEKVKNK